MKELSEIKLLKKAYERKMLSSHDIDLGVPYPYLKSDMSIHGSTYLGTAINLR